MTTTYSTKYKAYFKSGAVLSGEISSKSKPELLEKMKLVRKNECCGIDVEVITFEGIVKTTSLKEENGLYLLFGKITNSYLSEEILAKYYKPLA